MGVNCSQVWMPTDVEGMPRVIVTRPQPQADEWVLRLRELGLGAQAFPLMCIEPLPAQSPTLDSAWRDLPGESLVMFVSPNAVLRFFEAARGRPWPAGVLAGATGPGTAHALMGCGVPRDLIVQPDADSPRFDAETLWTQRLSGRSWQGASVCIVRGEDGRDWLADTLRQAGASVHALAAYRRCAPLWTPAEVAALSALAEDPQAVWLFSSSQCIDHLVQRWTPEVAAGLRRQLVLATHPRIARTAEAAGFERVGSVSPDAEVIARRLCGRQPT